MAKSLLTALSVLGLASAAALPASSLHTLVTRDSLPAGWSASTSTCIAEGTTGRALTGKSTTSGSMTPALCSSFCSAAGYSIAGVEYSSECYCGNVLTNGATTTISSQCTMKCSGDKNSTCGGSGALNLFVSSTASLTPKTVTLPTGWSSSGCIAEGTTGRALASASTSSSNMTVSNCISYCTSAGFQYAGLEYSSECHCGDSIINGASLSTTSTGCTMLCSGDSSTTCGGSNALQVYNNPSLALSNTVSNGYSLQGCIQEVSGRALTGATKVATNMTVDICTSTCAAQGFTYAGLEYGSECYCGSALSNGASISTLSTQCYMTCAGDSSKNCGGPDAIQLYYDSAVTVATSTVTSATSTASASASATATPTGLLKLTFADDGTTAGYVKSYINPSQYNSYLLTSDVNSALKIYKPQVDTDNQNVLITEDTMTSGYPYLAHQLGFTVYDDYFNYNSNHYGYLLPAATTFTPGPAQFVHNWWCDNTGYSRDSEVAMWKLSSATNRLTAKWYNPDGSSIDSITLYVATQNDQPWIGLTGNLTLLNQLFHPSDNFREVYFTYVE